MIYNHNQEPNNDPRKIDNVSFLFIAFKIFEQSITTLFGMDRNNIKQSIEISLDL